MKIIIVTQDAPLYMASFLDNFLALAAKTHHVVKNIVVSSPYSKNGFIEEIKNRYDYYGFIDFVKIGRRIFSNKFFSFMYNIFPAIGCFSINNVLKKYNISKYKTDSVNSKDFLELIKNNSIDLIVSIAYPKIFKNEILTLPKNGCINYHTSLLPKYRGRQPLFWALLNQEKEVGITIHEIDDKIDNGRIIIQERIAVGPQDTLHNLYIKTIKKGPKLLMNAIERLDDNCRERIENNILLSTYNSFPKKKDVQLFRAKGKRFI